MYKSQLDNSKEITANNCAVSLLTLKNHAQIALEYVQDNKLITEILDIGDRVTSKICCGNLGCGNVTGYAGDAKVHDRFFDKLKYEKKSAVALVNIEKAMAMKKTALEKKYNFSLFGHASVFNVLKSMCGAEPGYNCISWAIELLTISGIKIEIDGGGFNVVTRPNSHVEKKFNPIGIKEAVRFAKDGNIDAFRANFSTDFNVNQVVKNASAGPVESFLGKYSPLALAVSYHQYEMVKVLIQEYNANIYQKSGRKEDFDAKRCIKQNFWFARKSPEEAKQIKALLKSL